MNDRPRQTVSVLGAGIMGNAIATRLLEVGHSVTVFDIDEEKVNALVQKGAEAALSIAEATERSEFVILSLNHANIVKAVVFGENGVVSAGTEDKLLIDMSSIDPVETKTFAENLQEACGMRWLDCPLSGGAPGALNGRLTVMAGGSEVDFERSKAVMDDLCANFTLMGPNGAGQTTKLVNQLFCAVIFQSLAEAVKVAEAGGVDPRVIPKALAGGRADSALLQEFMVKFAERDYTPTGRIDNMLKDLDALQSFAMRTKTPLPMTGQVVEILRMLCANGLGPKDSVEIIRVLDGMQNA
ncbi:NAD(P)-dependent oxidoreductase [Rhodobacteraceae bacterium RKSG542]|uniref:NAD(P)-dependent oxidoreductase n=1 Tax=Pseudovibrio flavus TaxID=2529854 RepID=UPI0012BB7C0B|nr:NAD(P)-dependent oxidoreductase [Pseudovibrio flavus]MTI18577.1 NAD(P)-dependent oxidoreductase [Pseudovibrio flavus]